MTDQKPPGSAVLHEVEVASKEYADQQSALLSLQVQRAFIAGALKGYTLAFTNMIASAEVRPPAANDS